MIAAKFTVFKFTWTENFVASFVFLTEAWSTHLKLQVPSKVGFLCLLPTVLHIDFCLYFLLLILLQKYAFNKFTFLILSSSNFSYYHIFSLNDSKKYALRKIVISFLVLIPIAHKDIQISLFLKNMLKE